MDDEKLEEAKFLSHLYRKGLADAPEVLTPPETIKEAWGDLTEGREILISFPDRVNFNRFRSALANHKTREDRVWGASGLHKSESLIAERVPATSGASCSETLLTYRFYLGIRKNKTIFTIISSDPTEPEK